MIEYIDNDELRKAIGILKPDGELFEIRLVPPQKNKKPISGYFRDVDTLLEALKTVDLRDMNVYFSLNEVKDACYSRMQRDKFVAGANTTSDGDISRYEWFFIDVDPIRPTGTSSTKEELMAARSTAKKIYDYLQGLGFSEPLRACSGNGYHLLYRISLLKSDDAQALVTQALKVIAELFNDGIVKIDTVNSNPSRICKIYGSLAQKGANTPERPHRMSKIFGAPAGMTSEASLQKLVAELPEVPPAPQPTREAFDLLPWMQHNGLEIYGETEGIGCQIYSLRECPFDHSHTNGDSKIFHYTNGAIAFKCHHNSCRDYKWQDVRKLFDPAAYDTQDDGHIDDGYRQYKANRQQRVEADYAELSGEEELNDEPMFYTANDILALPEEKEEFILTGCTDVDRKLRGLKKGAVSVLSGNRSSAKSTWLNQVALTAIEHGNTVIVYSGELSQKNVFKWMFLQAAGNHNIESRQTPGFFFTAKEDKVKIAEWMNPYLHLYNNRYGNNFMAMQRILMKKIRETKADLVILDNLMVLDIREMNPGDKYAAQSAFVLALKRIAMQTNTHIIFVAHPRKTIGFLRLEDISGSGDIVNAVDNAFIIHRRNKDFEDRYKEFSKTTLDPCDNVIEICKDRENGTQDYFVPLWFDIRSKRLKNDPAEYIVYGWEHTDGFTDSTEQEELLFGNDT